MLFSVIGLPVEASTIMTLYHVAFNDVVQVNIGVPPVSAADTGDDGLAGPVFDTSVFVFEARVTLPRGLHGLYPLGLYAWIQ